MASNQYPKIFRVPEYPEVPRGTQTVWYDEKLKSGKIWVNCGGDSQLEKSEKFARYLSVVYVGDVKHFVYGNIVTEPTPKGALCPHLRQRLVYLCISA